MNSIFDEAQEYIHYLDSIAEKTVLVTCYECDCGCDINHAEYIKLPELTNKVWACYECLNQIK